MVGHLSAPLWIALKNAAVSSPENRGRQLSPAVKFIDTRRERPLSRLPVAKTAPAPSSGAGAIYAARGQWGIRRRHITPVHCNLFPVLGAARFDAVSGHSGQYRWGRQWPVLRFSGLLESASGLVWCASRETPPPLNSLLDLRFGTNSQVPSHCGGAGIPGENKGGDRKRVLRASSGDHVWVGQSNKGPQDLRSSLGQSGRS